MVNIFVDGPDLAQLQRFVEQKAVVGITTNPSLVARLGVSNYRVFAEQISEVARGLDVSFEVLSDDPEEMISQAKVIRSWCENARIKIPVSNSRGQSTEDVVSALIDDGIKVNLTAVTCLEQLTNFDPRILGNSDCIISIFVGRIMDLGIDPEQICAPIFDRFSDAAGIKFLWASTREIYNIKQAQDLGFDIITIPSAMIVKMSELREVDLKGQSSGVIKQFLADAKNSGLTIR